MWHLGTWFNADQGRAGLAVGLNDLKVFSNLVDVMMRCTPAVRVLTSVVMKWCSYQEGFSTLPTVKPSCVFVSVLMIA